jgi:hypothetical protein
VNQRRPSVFFPFRTALQAATAIALVSLALLMTRADAVAQSKRPAPSAPTDQVRATAQLARLRDDFIQATKDYKASLEKLLVIYAGNVRKAERRLAQSRELFAEGLVAKRELDENALALTTATEKSNSVRQQMATADAQIANTLVETQADEQMARSPRPASGVLVQTTSFIRYNGPGAWSLSDAWKPENFFREKFGRPLPVAVFGQGAIHDRWRLDHRNAMDVDLNPASVEGQALIDFLRSKGIPFSAFRSAIPGTATGPHIHVGRPSHRY